MSTKTLLIVAALAAVVLFVVMGHRAPTTTAPAAQFTGPPVVPRQQAPAMNTQQPKAQGSSLWGKLKSAAASAVTSAASAAIGAGKTAATKYVAAHNK